MTNHKPKKYFNNNKMVNWGQGLSSEQMECLRQGEILTLRDRDGKPCAQILMDSYSQIRERKL